MKDIPSLKGFNASIKSFIASGSDPVGRQSIRMYNSKIIKINKWRQRYIWIGSHSFPKFSVSLSSGTGNERSGPFLANSKSQSENLSSVFIAPG